MKRILFILFTVGAITACLRNNDGEDLGRAREELNYNLSKWQDADIHDYQFIYNRFCFCLPMQDVVINVQADKVDSAFYKLTGEYLTADQLVELPTIVSLFNTIEDAINRGAYKLTATYDDNYGYPVDVSIDYDKNAIDEEFGFNVSGFM